METVEILGVRVACIDVPGMLVCVEHWSSQAARRTVQYVNAHCLNEACRDPLYRNTLNRADLVYSDGISVVWSSRFLGGCRMYKTTGADWIVDFCTWAAACGVRIYILAGRPGVAQQAADNLGRRFPGLQIVGLCDGYFSRASEAEVLAEIDRLKPQVVFVGMGTPRQEKWIAAQRRAIDAPVCWAVGALFDYVAGIEPRAPGWMKKLALEWFWRLLIDPAGKWKRYLLGNPLFVFRILRQKLQKKKPAACPD